MPTPSVTGIVSVNDRSLAPLMDALAARGVQVPRDMSSLLSPRPGLPPGRHRR